MKALSRLLAICLVLMQVLLAAKPCTARGAERPMPAASTENTQSQTHAPTVTIMMWISNPTMTVDGIRQDIDPSRVVTPVIKVGRTFVPARAIVVALGGVVSWHEGDRRVSITRADVEIDLWIGKGVASVNSIPVQVDPANPQVVPEIVNGRTMLPLRFIAESLGCTVTWSQGTRGVTITLEQTLIQNANRSVTLAVEPNATATCTVYLRNPLATGVVVSVSMLAADLPRGWAAEFCCGDVCCFKSMEITLDGHEQKRIELSVQTRGVGEGTVSLFVGSDRLESEGINVHVISKGDTNG